MSFPYLDLAGFMRRSVLSQGDVMYVENDSPGYTAQAISSASSYINGRLRKRYGNRRSQYFPPATGANSLPLGQNPPPLLGVGTNPPSLAFQGQPLLGSLQMLITITTPGPTGTALFTWSPDNGINNHTGTLSAGTVALPGTGMSLIMPTMGADTFSADNIYTAPTPVPEVVLGWLTTLVSYRVLRRRGLNPQDPVAELLVKDVETVMAELKEAADSKDGLFDLPVNEDEDSAVTTGGPTGYSEVSPYVWQDVEQTIGRAQDAQYESFFGGEVPGFSGGGIVE